MRRPRDHLGLHIRSPLPAQPHPLRPGPPSPACRPLPAAPVDLCRWALGRTEPSHCQRAGDVAAARTGLRPFLVSTVLPSCTQRVGAEPCSHHVRSRRPLLWVQARRGAHWHNRAYVLSVPRAGRPSVRQSVAFRRQQQTPAVRQRLRDSRDRCTGGPRGLPQKLRSRQGRRGIARVPEGQVRSGILLGRSLRP